LYHPAVKAKAAGPSTMRLDAELAAAIGPDAPAIQRALAGLVSDARVVVARHGSVVGYLAPVARAPRRVVELDRHGTPLAMLRWSGDTLEGAWVRGPDGAWLGIEPRATPATPWGLADRLGRAQRPGATGTPLTVFEALDWSNIERLPTLADPAALPPGAGVAVLNLIAALAADQRRASLVYAGPYPTEQLFLALLEAFHYTPVVDDPLAAFIAGQLAWAPAPHERVVSPDGLSVQLRGRVEKVVWRGRTYHRPDWQHVTRHAPRRIWDADDGVRCSLWALGAPLEDHLVLGADGTLLRSLDPPLASGPGRPLPASVAAALGAVVATRSAPALGPFIRDEASRLGLAWAPVAGDLVEIGPDQARFSARLRGRLRAALEAAGDRAARATVALATLSELAQLLGDALRARAQARLASRPPAEQEALLTAPPPTAGAGDAPLITAAVEALLGEANLRSRGRRARC
jgi:hypothetical protein